MALKRNKSLVIGQIKQQQAYYNSKAAKTNYLPKISATAGYLYTNNEISILNDKQKSSLSNIGTNLTGKFGEIAGNILQQHPELAPLIQAAGQYMPQVGQALNGVGKDIVDAFRTDTRNMMGATILLSQPLYMGGKIRAYHKITRYAEEIAGEQLRADEQETLLEVDQAYWQVVSLAIYFFRVQKGAACCDPYCDRPTGGTDREERFAKGPSALHLPAQHH